MTAPLATVPMVQTETSLPMVFDRDAYVNTLRQTGWQRTLAAAYDYAVAQLVGPNDVQVDRGRTFKKKSAWRKLARHFSIDVRCSLDDVRMERHSDGEFTAYAVATAIAPWGQTWQDVGACGTDEEKGKREITEADAVATAMTRASNRSVSNLIAMGEVSAEEMRRLDTRPSRVHVPPASPAPVAGSAGGAGVPSSDAVTRDNTRARNPRNEGVVDSPREPDAPSGVRCPKCGSPDVWDNRADKKGPRSPDFRCKNCKEPIWIVAPTAATVQGASLDDGQVRSDAWLKKMQANQARAAAPSGAVEQQFGEPTTTTTAPSDDEFPAALLDEDDDLPF